MHRVERSVDVGEVGPIGRRGVWRYWVSTSPASAVTASTAARIAGESVRWMVPSSLYAVVEGRIDGRERHAPSLTLPAEVATTAG